MRVGYSLYRLYSEDQRGNEAETHVKKEGRGRGSVLSTLCLPFRKTNAIPTFPFLLFMRPCLSSLPCFFFSSKKKRGERGATSGRQKEKREAETEWKGEEEGK